MPSKVRIRRKGPVNSSAPIGPGSKIICAASLGVGDVILLGNGHSDCILLVKTDRRWVWVKTADEWYSFLPKDTVVVGAVRDMEWVEKHKVVSEASRRSKERWDALSDAQKAARRAWLAEMRRRGALAVKARRKALEDADDRHALKYEVVP